MLSKKNSSKTGEKGHSNKVNASGKFKIGGGATYTIRSTIIGRGRKESGANGTHPGKGNASSRRVTSHERGVLMGEKGEKKKSWSDSLGTPSNPVSETRNESIGKKTAKES